MPTQINTWAELRDAMRASIDTGGHTFAFFSAVLGISRSHVVRMVREGQVPNLDQAEKIAQCLGRTIHLRPAKKLSWTKEINGLFHSAFNGNQEYRITKNEFGYEWVILSYGTPAVFEGVESRQCDSFQQAKSECEQHFARQVS